jgi:hypothetical protein
VQPVALNGGPPGKIVLQMAKNEQIQKHNEAFKMNNEYKLFSFVLSKKIQFVAQKC